MTNFMNWLGAQLQTPGSVGAIGFKMLIALAVFWLIMTILENK